MNINFKAAMNILLMLLADDNRCLFLHLISYVPSSLRGQPCLF